EVAGRALAVVHPALFYLGLRQSLAGGQSWVALPGKPRRLDLVALGMDGKTLQPGVAASVVVSRRLWLDKWIPDPSGNGTYQETYQDLPVYTTSLTTRADGRAGFSFVPSQAGDYHVVVTARDALGHPVRSSLDVWVSTWGYQYADWGSRGDDGVRLI